MERKKKKFEAHLSLLIITHLGPGLGVDNAGDFHFHPNIRVNPSLVNMNFRLIYNRKYSLSTKIVSNTINFLQMILRSILARTGLSTPLAASQMYVPLSCRLTFASESKLPLLSFSPEGSIWYCNAKKDRYIIESAGDKCAQIFLHHCLLEMNICLAAHARTPKHLLRSCRDRQDL